MSEITTVTSSGAALHLATKLWATLAQEVGELISDYVRGWRLENLAGLPRGCLSSQEARADQSRSADLRRGRGGNA